MLNDEAREQFFQRPTTDGFFLIGGERDAAGTISTKVDQFVFDFSSGVSGTWTELGNMIVPRKRPMAVFTDETCP